MADLSFAVTRRGTPLVWGYPGGTVAPIPTAGLDLSLRNLPNNDSWGGTFADLSTDRPEWLEVQLILESEAAPDADSASYLYLAWSSDLTNLLPGDKANADAQYASGEVNNRQRLRNLDRVITFAHQVDLNDRRVQVPEVVPARTQFLAPVVYNRSGAAYANNGTATEHAGRVVITPIYRVAVDQLT